MKARNKNTFTTTLLALLCVAFSPQTRAACGSPDPGCAGGNLAEGAGALLSLTTGTYNTAIGYLSLRRNTEGGFNTGVGSGALLSNNSGRNTATGAAALLSNTTGPANTANGALALLSNTEGGYNTAVGDRALQVHTAGDRNTAIGASALLNDITGSQNTAIGAAALLSNATGFANTAIGDSALALNAASFNTAIGFQALSSNTTGDDNMAAGTYALANNTTGDGNTALGDGAGVHVTTANNVICIGLGVGENVGDSCYIGNIWNQSGGSQAVYVNSEGKLGYQVSSRRFKDEIKTIAEASEAIYGLRPVSFRYKPEIEPTRLLGFGLIAEEVEKVSPDLVIHAKNGKSNSVRYDAVNAMLLNEFLKEHKTVQELKKEIAALQKTVREQNSKIQKVSDQLELNNPSPQLVDNNK